MNGKSKAWQDVVSPVPEFIQAGDDFSVKLTLTQDPRFWWRIEKRQKGQPLLVTDFAAGSQAEATMAAAFELLLSAQEDQPTKVIFRDLVPRDLDTGEYRIALTQVAQSVQGWCVYACERLGCRIVTVICRMIAARPVTLSAWNGTWVNWVCDD